MSLLTFPSSPSDGQLYPTTPTIGQAQYQWEAATSTWRLLGTATGVTAGTYSNVDITVDATGRITDASSVAGATGTFTTSDGKTIGVTNGIITSIV